MHSDFSLNNIQRNDCQPEKTTIHGGGQSRSWSAEQGKESKRSLQLPLHDILLFTFLQAPISVCCLDGTIIDSSSTILVTTYYYCGYVGV